MIDKKEYIFGLRAVIEAIEAGKDIDRVLIRKDLAGGDLARELLAKIKEYGVVSQRVPLEKLNRITMKNHQGAIALLSAVGYYDLEQMVPSLYEEGMLPFIVLLDGITDTHNFGAIAIEEAVRYLKDSGFVIVGATEKGVQDYTEADYTGPVAIVMGAEDTGISDPVLRLCDTLAAIPIIGSIGSLHVSVAAGVMMYEAVRQRIGAGQSHE